MTTKYKLSKLTLARPGGHICAPPSHRFFADSGKVAARRQTCHNYSFILCASCVKILTPGHTRSGLQVTLSDVTSKHNLATLPPCHSHSYELSVFKLLEVDEVNSSSNLHILDIFIFVTCPCCQWAKFKLPLFRIGTFPFTRNGVGLGPQWWPRRQFSSVTLQRSSEVT